MFTWDTFTWGKCHFTIENVTQYNRNVNLPQVNVSRVKTALETIWKFGWSSVWRVRKRFTEHAQAPISTLSSPFMSAYIFSPLESLPGQPPGYASPGLMNSDAERGLNGADAWRPLCDVSMKDKMVRSVVISWKQLEKGLWPCVTSTTTSTHARMYTRTHTLTHT